MGILEKVMKKRQERTAEIDKLTEELERLKENRERLEIDILAAIDGDDSVLAEKLVNQRRELDTKIEVKKLTIERKTSQEEDITDLIEASNKETAEYQRKINQKEAAVLEAKKEYLSKLLDLAGLVNEAWDKRTQYCQQIPDVEDPTTYNTQTSAFTGVSTTTIRWERGDVEMLKEINPDAMLILHSASKDHANIWVGRK